MEKIIIKEAAFFCNIGVTPKERAVKQEIVIDVELFLDRKKSSQTRSLEDTVDYSKVHDSIKDATLKNKFKLIEELAENIAKEILDNFPVEKVVVGVKKPKALSDRNVKYVAIEIIRSK